MLQLPQIQSPVWILQQGQAGEPHQETVCVIFPAQDLSDSIDLSGSMTLNFLEVAWARSRMR
jgi:hypothetical protein